MIGKLYMYCRVQILHSKFDRLTSNSEFSARQKAMISSEESSSDVHIISSLTFSASRLSSTGRVMRIVLFQFGFVFLFIFEFKFRGSFTQGLNIFDLHFVLGMCQRICTEEDTASQVRSVLFIEKVDT